MTWCNFPMNGNYHEPSVDWLVNEIKKALQEWETTKEQWTSLEDFVKNYFSNLDVQEEINNKLDEMSKNGELQSIIDKYLLENLFIDNESPTIDNLLFKHVNDIYPLFDEYVTSGLLSKDTLGYATLAASGDEGKAEPDVELPIYRYRYTRDINNLQAVQFINQISTGRIIITACLHGNEKTTIPCLLTLLKHMNSKDNRMVNYIMKNFDIDFVPIVNPHGFNVCADSTITDIIGTNSAGRVNGRGVNLNRNAYSGWSGSGSSDPQNPNYRGLAPNSELESQILYNTFANVADSYVYWLDLHCTITDIVFQGLFSPNQRPVFINTMASFSDRMKKQYGINIDDYTGSIGGGMGNGGEPTGEFMTHKNMVNTAGILEFRKIDTQDNGISTQLQRYSSEFFVNMLYNLCVDINSNGENTYNMYRTSPMLTGDNILRREDFILGSWDRTTKNYLEYRTSNYRNVTNKISLNPSSEYELYLTSKGFDTSSEYYMNYTCYDANNNETEGGEWNNQGTHYRISKGSSYIVIYLKRGATGTNVVPLPYIGYSCNVFLKEVINNNFGITLESNITNSNYTHAIAGNLAFMCGVFTLANDFTLNQNVKVAQISFKPNLSTFCPVFDYTQGEIIGEMRVLTSGAVELNISKKPVGNVCFNCCFY